MASSGFQADVKALQKNLAARHLVRFLVSSYFRLFEREYEVCYCFANTCNNCSV